MKSLSLVFLCLALLLLAAASAQAFAVYNHVDQQVCAQQKVDVLVGSCDFIVPSDGDYNGEHGAGWTGRVVWFTSSYSCRGTDYFDIPDGGYARIHNDVVKIYKHDNTQVGDKNVDDCDCPNQDSGKKKP
ncbi:hypothetical protein [Desulfoferula mesophila]|uniref:Secreted protein n=1 Tax=Desulfoferula mesophila TaxID=3058419 RepID=A0AAU9EIB7_9BACT|nr:hypothetical protein FAK_00950 [Desulfoferula mesophilus]